LKRERSTMMMIELIGLLFDNFFLKKKTVNVSRALDDVELHTGVVRVAIVARGCMHLHGFFDA